MQPLPIDPHLPRIVSRLRESGALVLVAEPGAGKTTRLPPAVLRDRLLSAEHPNLVLLQPRRVAARAAAARIAEENGWELGGEVGYQVRFERQMTAATRLRVMTEGILTRQLVDDPFLEGVGAVVLDEFHERSIHTDLAIALLREVRQTVRPDLLLVVMSATLSAEPVAQFLGGCPVERIEGRTFPVHVEHAGQFQGATRASELADRVAEAISGPLAPVLRGEGEGDILIFLPGAEEIRRTMHRLQPLADQRDWLLLPLHGSLPFEEQVRALRPADRTKVILATNIAETSLTIDGVTTVIDSGLARVADYDPHRGLDRLHLKRISKASATQRTGRAGRTAPGRCIRLWSAAEHASLADFELPEIRRVDLASTVLALHAWGKPDPRAFGWFESPKEDAIASAERLLAMLGALDAEQGGKITPLGRRILSLPVHPRLARLLIAAASAGLAEKGAALAALLSEKDIARSDSVPQQPRRARTTADSDMLVRLERLDRAEREHFRSHLRDEGMDPIAARQVAHTRDQLLRLTRRISIRNPQSAIRNDDALRRLILLAYPDRVAHRRSAESATLVGGGGVKLSGESAVHQAEFFLALDARQDDRSTRREAFVRVASAIDVTWLEELFPQQVRRVRDVVFDAERQRVVGRSGVYYRDLLLREDASAAVDPQQAADVLHKAIEPLVDELFSADESASNLLARVALLRQAMPEHPWPKLGRDELSALLREACEGKRSVEELRRTPLSPLIRARLVYPLDRLVDQEAPEAVAVPTGNHIRLDYRTEAGRPVLAVRLQEMFGLADTPRIAAGRVKVLLHLLGPNYRPVQITDDLRSFWANTYPQVRKDLRARYPKHSWPEDPWTAKPQAKGGRRR